MKNTRSNISRWITRFVTAVLALISVMSLASCGESKTEDAAKIIADQFESIWSIGACEVLGLQLYQYGESNCYYITFKERGVEDAKTVEAIIVSDHGSASEYIHSVDFERFSDNKLVYQEYLNAKDAGTLYTFTDEEVAEVQSKLEGILDNK